MNWNTNLIFSLEDKLNFSRGIPLNFFTWKTDKLNFFPWKTNWTFQRVYLWIFSFGRQTNWTFSLGRQTEFLKRYAFEFFHLEDRQTDFFPLENKLNFSLGTQTKFFKGYLLPLNFSPWKTNLIFQRALTTLEFFFPWKINWIFQRVYLLTFSLGRQTEFVKVNNFLSLRSKSNLLKSVNYWLNSYLQYTDIVGTNFRVPNSFIGKTKTSSKCNCFLLSLVNI